MQENEGKKENEKEEVVKENGDVLKTIADISKGNKLKKDMRDWYFFIFPMAPMACGKKSTN